MNVEEIKNSLRELKKKYKQSQKQRDNLIKEMDNLQHKRPKFKKIKTEEGAHKVQVELEKINLDGAKEARAEKQKQLDQQVPNQVKERDRRMISSNFANYLQRAKRDLDNQKEILEKQKLINKRQEEKDKKELQDMKEDQNKRKEQLVQQKKELEKELAADEYKRQSLILELNMKTLKDFFITKAAPHILWKPVKTNEGMNHLKEYSTQRINEMEQELKEKLQKAYQQFCESQQQKQKEKIEPEHESSASDTEESQQQQEGGQK